MPRRLEPHIEILPAAQREVWPQLRPAARLAFVLYGGTAVALHLGHRVSLETISAVPPAGSDLPRREASARARNPTSGR